MSTNRTDSSPVPTDALETEGAPGGPLRLLFVCTGNTCRSPMAEALARDLLEDRGPREVEIRSAGTSAADGHPASQGALMVASRHGLDLGEHRSAHLNAELVAWADLIFAMNATHLQRVEELGGSEKAVLLGTAAQNDPEAGSAVGEPADLSVPDPFGGNDETYEETYQIIKSYLTRALDRLGGEGGD